MKFPIVASLILFVIFLGLRISVVGKIEKSSQKEFFDRESKANSIRKKSLDAISYVSLHLDALPMHTLEDDPDVLKCLTLITSLSDKKIVNLSQFSNTDLKIEYGTANLTILSEYDQNFTDLVCTLQTWAELLHSASYTKEAISVLEFAISIKTDISKSYQLLGELYLESGLPEKIGDLILLAKALPEPASLRITKRLQAMQVDQLL